VIRRSVDRRLLRIVGRDQFPSSAYVVPVGPQWYRRSSRFWYRQTGPEVPPLGFLLMYLAIAFTGLNRHRAAPRLSPREVGRRLIFALSICLIPHMGGSSVKGDAGYFNRLRSIT
jgi:hypothetical protein